MEYIELLNNEGNVELLNIGWAKYYVDNGYSLYFDMYILPNKDVYYLFDSYDFDLDPLFRANEEISDLWNEIKEHDTPRKFKVPPCNVKTMYKHEIEDYIQEIIDTYDD